MCIIHIIQQVGRVVKLLLLGGLLAAFPFFAWGDAEQNNSDVGRNDARDERFPGKGQAQSDRVRIGISLPLTGDGATYGSDFQKTYRYANEVLAQNRYQLIFVDDRCSGRDAVTAAHKLINVDRVRYVLGATCDGVFSSAGPVYQKAGVVVISTSASYVPGDGLFHTEIRVSAWGPFFYSYIAERAESLGVLAEQSGFAQGFKDNFLQANKDGRLKIISEDFTVGETDLRSTLTRFKSKDLDGLLVLNQTETSLLTVVQGIEKQGLDIPIYGVFFPGSRRFLELAGKAAEGIIYLDFVDFELHLSSSGRTVYQGYLKRYGEPSSGKGLFIRAFEAFRAMHLALSSQQDPITFLTETEFDGIAGAWRFDEDGFWDGSQLAVNCIVGGKPGPCHL